MKKLPDNCVDMVLTDPPYGTTACKWDSIIPLELMWVQLKRLINDNGAVVLFGYEPFSSVLRMSNINQYKYDWVWHKNKATNHLNAKKMPMRKNELISVFYKEQCLYNPQLIKKDIKNIRYTIRKRRPQTELYGTMTNTSKRQIPINESYPHETLYFNNVCKHRYHPTQKPVELMEYLINTYTNKKDVVLDFTMGSGTTGVACKKLDRNFIGIELDKKYYDIAIKRIKSVRINNLDKFMKKRKKGEL